MDGEEEREQSPPRPRVVDKRVSARPADAAPADPEPDVPSAEAPAASRGAAEAAEEAPPPEQVWTPEQEAEARRLTEEFARISAQDWVLNAAVTLANVAGVKLQERKWDEAGLAIDVLAAVIDAAGDRAGDAEPLLKQSLAQLRMAFVQGSREGEG